jgi:hypothetical protein
MFLLYSGQKDEFFLMTTSVVVAVAVVVTSTAELYISEHFWN